MEDASFYKVNRAEDHVDRLYQIINLAKVGAASTDTTLDVANLESGHCCLFEVIHRLASEAIEIAEVGLATSDGQDVKRVA